MITTRSTGLAAIDAIPEQTLSAVMLEIAESRERARMIDPDKLRARAERRISEIPLRSSVFLDYRTGKGDAYRQVLRWLDELEGGE